MRKASNFWPSTSTVSIPNSSFHNTWSPGDTYIGSWAPPDEYRPCPTATTTPVFSGSFEEDGRKIPPTVSSGFSSTFTNTRSCSAPGNPAGSDILAVRTDLVHRELFDCDARTNELPTLDANAMIARVVRRFSPRITYRTVELEVKLMSDSCTRVIFWFPCVTVDTLIHLPSRLGLLTTQCTAAGN